MKAQNKKQVKNFNTKLDKKKHILAAQPITIKNLNQNSILLGKIIQVNTQNIKLEFQNSIQGVVKLQNTIGYKVNQWLQAIYIHTEQYQHIFSIDPIKLNQNIQENKTVQVIIQSVEDNGYMCMIPGQQFQMVLANEDCNNQKYVKGQIILAHIQSIQQNICQLTQKFDQPIEEYQVQDLQVGDLIKINVFSNRDQLPVQQLTQEEGKYQIYIEEHQKAGTSEMNYRVVSKDNNLGNIFISNKQTFITFQQQNKQQPQQTIKNPQILFQTHQNVYFKTDNDFIGKISKKQIQKISIENNIIQSQLRLLYFMQIELVAVYVLSLESEEETNISVGKELYNVKLIIKQKNQFAIHGIFNINKKEVKFQIPSNLFDQQLQNAQQSQIVNYQHILVIAYNNETYTLNPLFQSLQKNVQIGCIYQGIVINQQLNKVVLSNGMTFHLLEHQPLQIYQKLNVIIFQFEPNFLAIQIPDSIMNEQSQMKLTQQLSINNIKYIQNYHYLPQTDSYLKYSEIEKDLKTYKTEIKEISSQCYITKESCYIPLYFVSDNIQNEINNKLINNEKYELEVKQISGQFKIVVPKDININREQAVIISQNQYLFAALCNSIKLAQIKGSYQVNQFQVINVQIYEQSKTRMNTVFAQLQDKSIQALDCQQNKFQWLQLPQTNKLNDQIIINQVAKCKFLLFSHYNDIKFAVFDLGLGQIGILPVQNSIQQQEIQQFKLIPYQQVKFEDAQLQLIGLEKKDYQNKQVNLYLLKQDIQQQNQLSCIYSQNNLCILLANDGILYAIHQIDYNSNKLLTQDIKVNQQVDIQQYTVKDIKCQLLLPFSIRNVIQKCLIIEQQNQIAYILPEIHQSFNDIYKYACLSLSQQYLNISLLDMEDTQFSGITDVKLIEERLSTLDEQQNKSFNINDIVYCISLVQKEDRVYVLLAPGIKGILNIQKGRKIKQGTKLRCRILRKLNNYLVVSDDRILLSPTYTQELQVQQAHIAQIVQFTTHGIKLRIVDTYPQHYGMIFYSSFQNNITKDNVQQLYQINSFIAVVTTKIEEKKIDCISSDAALVEVGANVQQIKQLLQELNYKGQKQIQQHQKQTQQEQQVQQAEQQQPEQQTDEYEEEQQEQETSQQSDDESINEDNYISEEQEENSIKFDSSISNEVEEEQEESMVHFDDTKETKQKEYLTDEQYIELLNQNNQNLMAYINYSDKYYQEQNILKAQQILQNGIQTLKDLNDKVQLIIISLIYTNEAENQVTMLQHLLNYIKTFQAPSMICQQFNNYIIEKQLVDVGIQMWSSLWKKKETKAQVDNIKAYFDFLYALNLEKNVNINQIIDNIYPVEQLDVKLYVAEKEYSKGRFEIARNLLMNHKQLYSKMFKLEEMYVKPENVVSFYKLIIPKCNQKLEKQLLKMLIEFVKTNKLDQEDIKNWISNLQ